jgi:hypothetical protein
MLSVVALLLIFPRLGKQINMSPNKLHIMMRATTDKTLFTVSYKK